MLQGLKIGDESELAYEPRGGYGYTQQIAGVVTRLGQARRFRIRVAKRDGDNVGSNETMGQAREPVAKSNSGGA